MADKGLAPKQNMQRSSITEHTPSLIKHGCIAINVKIQMSLFFVLNHSFWGHDITLSLGNRLVGMLATHLNMLPDIVK